MSFKRLSSHIALPVLLFGSLSYGHNNVVVIPMAGDTVYKYGIGSTGPGGGIVFYVSDAEGLHGLEAAPEDQSIGLLKWGCDDISIATSSDTGTGSSNTDSILDGCTTTPIAASVARAYNGGGFTDWFLPSKDELNLLYLKKDIVGGFVDFYWSSSEFSTFGTFSAWYQYFLSGEQQDGNKANLLRVRAVRAF